MGAAGAQEGTLLGRQRELQGPRDGAAAMVESVVEGSMTLGKDDGWRKSMVAGLVARIDRKMVYRGRKGTQVKKKRAEKSSPAGINGGMTTQGRTPRHGACG